MAYDRISQQLEQQHEYERGVEEAAYLFTLTQQFDQHMALIGNDEKAAASFKDWFTEEYELDFHDEETAETFKENSVFWGRA